MKQNEYEAKVEQIRTIAPTVKSISLHITKRKEFTFLPGQFVIVSPQEKKEIRRSYSLASAPTKNELELCVKIVEGGALSSILDNLTKGQSITIEGPYGKFALQDSEKEKIFIAGGTGIAPLRSMIQSLGNIKTKTWLFYRFKEPQSCLYLQEWEELARTHEAFTFVPSTTDPMWKGETERPQALIKKYITTPENKEVYICGPPDMVREVVADLLQQGFTLEQIHREMW